MTRPAAGLVVGSIGRPVPVAVFHRVRKRMLFGLRFGAAMIPDGEGPASVRAERVLRVPGSRATATLRHRHPLFGGDGQCGCGGDRCELLNGERQVGGRWHDAAAVVETDIDQCSVGTVRLGKHVVPGFTGS